MLWSGIATGATFAELRRILVPDGIVVIWTSEIGAGVKVHHMWDWGLGDHLQFLGDQSDVLGSFDRVRQAVVAIGDGGHVLHDLEAFPERADVLLDIPV